MIKKTVVFLFALSILSLMGCQSLLTDTEKAVDISSKAIYVDEIVKSGAIVDSLFSSSLTQNETDSIQVSLKAYNDFVDKWGSAITKNPVEAIKNTHLIINEYHVLRIRYAEIERIVQANWQSYPPENQYLLLEYQKQAKELDRLVMDLLSRSKASTALLAVQRMGIVVGQIALKLI